MHKFLSIIILSILFISCGSNSETKKTSFTLKTDAPKNTITLGESIKLSINNPKNYTINSVSYTINGKSVNESFVVTSKLGVQNILATVNYNDTQEIVETSITILNNITPKVYSFKILNEYPHDITSYTQGLEFYNGE